MTVTGSFTRHMTINKLWQSCEITPTHEGKDSINLEHRPGLVLSQDVLMQVPEALPSQLVGRLISRNSPKVQALQSSVADQTDWSWMRPT